MEAIQPSVYIGGVRVDEPVTALTDLLVSAVCIYAFLVLHRLKKPSKVQQFIKYYFLSMAMATFLGGVIGHAFLYAFSFGWKLPGWLTSMFSIALIERAVIEKAKPIISARLGKFFTWLNLVELTLFVVLTFSTLNFFYVEVHSAYGLLVVTASFSLYTYAKTKNKGSKYFIVGVGFCAISALFFMNEWSLHIWFNYLDISHVLLAIAATFFYKGAMKID
ncbi:MAG: hypothetical protein OEX22_07065 [Cyclobacteriaceae bacterium]|nr:hypothetical protein [Cyclobacteriaceae bacterium]